MRKKASSTLGSVSSRAKQLKQRREPYWQPIVRGCALGYRKGASGGSWIARVRTQDGKQSYHALGAADDANDGLGLTYEAALAEARKHFALPGGASGRHTVGTVLDRYLEGLRAKNPESTVADAEARINSILKPAFGEIPLAKLRAEHIKLWRNGALKTRKVDTVNRLVGILKAALNSAWEDDLITDDRAWRKVKPVEGGGEARKVFLSAAQAQVLAASCSGTALRRLVQAALLTGARLGELAAARVHNFDGTTGTLEVLDGKTGPRTVYLSAEACGFFAGIAAGRAPKAPLLPREDGEPWRKNHHQKLFSAAVHTSALPEDTTFYALRHTHISLALLAGVNIQVLAENCGTSVRMIEKHYGKFLRADRRAMFDKISGLVATEG